MGENNFFSGQGSEEKVGRCPTSYPPFPGQKKMSKSFVFSPLGVNLAPIFNDVAAVSFHPFVFGNFT